MNATLLVTIITSAAVGALASSGLALIGQALERRARRREFLLGKAIDLAFQRTELVKQVGERSGRKVRIPPAISMAADYYDSLNHLLSTGDLPKRVREQEKNSAPQSG